MTLGKQTALLEREVISVGQLKKMMILRVVWLKLIRDCLSKIFTPGS